jgi:hypothetical protein
VPTVLRIGPYRFLSYSSDAAEPRHVHVQRDAGLEKFWRDPIRLDYSQGFRPAELRRIGSMIGEQHNRLIEAWDGYFGK